MNSAFRSSDASKLGMVLENGAFLNEFRREGLRSSLLAAYAALGLLTLFMVFQELSNRFTSEALVIRLLMVGVLSIGILIILRREEYAIKFYPFVVGGVCSVLFVGVVLILYHPGIEAVGVGFSSMPAVMFGLFLMYGFLRLPVRLALGIGCGFSALAVWAAGPEYSGAGKLRMLMYLCSVNVLGAVLANSIESRERNLFDQRYLLDEARKESEARARLAEGAYSEKLRMIATVNHDLRQPMLAAMTHLRSLRRRIVDGDFAEAFQQIQRIDDSIGFLGDTLDHLLTAARYESGTEPIRIEYCDLFAIIDQVRSAYLEEAARKGLEIRISCPEERLEILSDRASVSRILMNLVGNGVKFNRKSSTSGLGVLIRVRFAGGLCFIDVADTGIGIDSGDQARIWDPYVQLGNNSGDRAHGLGLGLFVVNAAMRRLMKHTIRMRSRVGRGTRFSLTAPGRIVRGENNPDLVQDSLNAMNLTGLAGAYVIVFIEDPEVRRAMGDLLGDWGIVSSCVGSLDELVSIEESSERMVDALLVGTSPERLLDAVGFIQSARVLLGQETISIVIGLNGALVEVPFEHSGRVCFINAPFYSNSLAAMILKGVEENRMTERSG